MRFMMILRPGAGSAPDARLGRSRTDAMERYNDELVMDGVLLAYESLHPGSAGALVEFSDSEARSATGGPPSGPETPITGFWVVQAASQDEALERARRVPLANGQVEVRQVYEPSER